MDHFLLQKFTFYLGLCFIFPSSMLKKFISKIVFLFLVSSCTTIGFHDSKKRNALDFGQEKQLRLCIYHDPEISKARIKNLIENLSEELKLYKIQVQVAIQKEYPRKHFFTEDSLNLLMIEKLPIECDRILALFSRNIFDFLLAIPFPEILGVVETYTRTRGIVYADYFTPNLLLGATPSRTFIHETYHLLGCDHALIMNECYHRIQLAKGLPSLNQFFPSFGTDEKIIFLSHEDVNKTLLSRKGK